jgi:hypothetical protein
MLEEALKVIEAVRALRLEKKGRLSGSGITDKLALAQAIDGLRDALETFDRLTGTGLGTPGYQARPDFATPPQFDDHGFTLKQELIDTRMAIPGMVPLPDGPEPEPEPEFRPSSAPGFSPSLSVPAGTARMAMDYLSTVDLGDVELNDGAESISDFLESLDMIEDKLQYAVNKVGWTPRLRALAEAANIAKRRIVLDVSTDGFYVRIPAQNWAALTMAITNAATERDNKLTIPLPAPQPKPQRKADMENTYSPRPPGYGF